MWGIAQGCKPQCRAQAGSAVATSDHNVNCVANTLKLSLKPFFHSKIYMKMFKI